MKSYNKNRDCKIMKISKANKFTYYLLNTSSLSKILIVKVISSNKKRKEIDWMSLLNLSFV